MPRKKMTSTPVSFTALGQQISHFRQRQGWTLRELAALAGIDHTSLLNFENGRQRLKPAVVDKLFSLFGAHVEVVAPASFAGVEEVEEEPERVAAGSA